MSSLKNHSQKPDQDAFELAALLIIDDRGTSFSNQNNLVIAYPPFLEEVQRRINALESKMPSSVYRNIIKSFIPDNPELWQGQHPPIGSQKPDYGLAALGIDQKKLEETMDRIILEIYKCCCHLGNGGRNY